MKLDSNQKSVIFLLVCVLLLFTALLIPYKRVQEKSFNKKEILGVLKEQSKIATTEVSIRKMGVYDSETEIKSLNPSKWKLGMRVCVVPVDVKIRYGIDLEKLNDSDIEILKGDSVRIHLPSPEIIDKGFVPTTDNNEVVVLKTGLRDDVGESTIQEIKNLAFEDVIAQEKDIKDKISDEIKNNTEVVFTSVLSQMGLTPVFVYE